MQMKKYKLGEIVEINASSIKSSEKIDEILYLDTANITENRIDTLQRFALEKAPSRAQRKVNDNTIIFSTVRPNQNHFGIMKNPATNLIVSSGFATLDIKNPNEFNADYLYYNLTQPFIVNYLQTVAQNQVSSYPSINPSDLANLNLSFPPFPEQKKIASVLSSLDEKIPLNRRINAKLDQMAKRLYDYWFVQFDFPNSDGKPYKSSGGKMAYNAELKREIPAGWEVKKLYDLVSFKNGINYDKNELGDKDYKIVNVRNISSSSLILSENELDRITLKSNIADNYLLSSKSILIARSGCPGEIRLLLNNNESVIFCGFIICLEPINDILKYYLTCSLKKLEKTNATKTGGSILQNVSQETLKRINIIIPPENLISSFNAKINPILLKYSKLQEENAKLTVLRDKILPLLMNGQVEVE